MRLAFLLSPLTGRTSFSVYALAWFLYQLWPSVVYLPKGLTHPSWWPFRLLPALGSISDQALGLPLRIASPYMCQHLCGVSPHVPLDFDVVSTPGLDFVISATAALSPIGFARCHRHWQADLNTLWAAEPIPLS